MIAPAIHAHNQVAAVPNFKQYKYIFKIENVPVIIAEKASSAKSFLRLGAIAPNAPI